MSDDTRQRSDPAHEPALTTESILALADAASLALAPERAAQVLPILKVWLADSARLNTLMQGDDYRDLLPITLFSQGPRSAADGQ